MRHERVRVSAEFGHDERHPLSHQAGNKGNVSGKPIQLGDDYTTFRSLGGYQGGGQLGAPVERIGSLCRFRIQRTQRRWSDARPPQTAGPSRVGFNSETRALLLLS